MRRSNQRNCNAVLTFEKDIIMRADTSAVWKRRLPEERVT